MTKPKRIGVLTGGGDCPGLNAVIRGVTKSLLLSHGADVVGIASGYMGLIERQVRPLRYADVSGILTLGGTILGTSNKANPFRYYRRGGEDVSDEVVAYVQELELDGVVAIGGDGTMSIAHGLQEIGVPIVGVPKTIDNDLVGTERTFGFDTAVAIATEAIDRLHSTAQSHRRVMILETMGRYAGWIALHAGLSSGADIILIPEIEYDVEEVARVCRKREAGGQKFTIIAIAEGAKPIGGELAVRGLVASSPDPLRLGGASEVLASQLERLVDSEIRTTILGHVQRGGTPTPFDRALATGFGVYASELAASDRYGHMVALQENRLLHIPLSAVANRVRTVPRDHTLIRSALGVGTSLGVPAFESRFDVS